MWQSLFLFLFSDLPMEAGTDLTTGNPSQGPTEDFDEPAHAPPPTAHEAHLPPPTPTGSNKHTVTRLPARPPIENQAAHAANTNFVYVPTRLA
jgi:hypothetical protein